LAKKRGDLLAAAVKLPRVAVPPLVGGALQLKGVEEW